jgi:hypothetical protein
MDLSKLPKMSDTRRAEAERQGQSPAPPMPNPLAASGPTPAVPAGRVVAVDAGGSGWISLIVGLLVMLFWPRLWTWISHKLFGTSFAPYQDAAGNLVPYTQTPDFWSDLAIGLFAVALIVEGIVLLWAATSRLAVWASLVIIAGATLFNLGFVVSSLSRGYAIPIVSALAVVFGAFMCIQQWQLLHGPRRRYLIVEE